MSLYLFLDIRWTRPSSPPQGVVPPSRTRDRSPKGSLLPLGAEQERTRSPVPFRLEMPRKKAKVCR